MKEHLPRLVIAGTQSGVGKTTLTLGIMAALKKRGWKVGPYKVGPDYIDPGFHTFATGTDSRNLDLWMLTEEKVQYLFQKNSQQVDLSVIEGVMGLYDGRGTDTEASTAHLSKVVQAPVVLVIDGSGVSASAAAQVLGYQTFDQEVNLQGVIINRVSGATHYQLLKEAIEEKTGVRVLGYLARANHLQLKSRHLGLIPGVEVSQLRKQLDELVSLVEESVDLDGLIELAHQAPDWKRVAEPVDLQQGLSGWEKTPLRIGVAYDAAFHFYYRDNLDLLEELGAELVYFSPLHDHRLPEDLDGLYIGGGFPEIFAQELAENQSLRRELRQVIQAGLPTYAECGGMIYLSRAIQTQAGERYPLVGAIPTESQMTEKLQRFGYVEVELGENLFDLPGQTVPAHEFHYSKLVDETELTYTYQIRRRKSSWRCGVATERVLAGYPHLHFYSLPQLAVQFLRRCRENRERGSGV